MGIPSEIGVVGLYPARIGQLQAGLAAALDVPEIKKCYTSTLYIFTKSTFSDYKNIILRMFMLIMRMRIFQKLTG